MFVIYNSLGKWYLTDEENYKSRIQNARKIKRLENVDSIEDAKAIIDKFCKWYNDTPNNYKIIQ